MVRSNQTKLFWSGLALIFGLLLLLGFVAPPDSGGSALRAQARPNSGVPMGPAEPAGRYTCADGVEHEMGIQVLGSQFSVVGELTATAPTGMYVRALPGQLVLAPPREGSAAHGYLAGDIVTASGYITPEGSYQAAEIAPACRGAVVTEITPQPTIAPSAPPAQAPAAVSNDQPGAPRLPAAAPAIVILPLDDDEHDGHGHNGHEGEGDGHGKHDDEGDDEDEDD